MTGGRKSKKFKGRKGLSITRKNKATRRWCYAALKLVCCILPTTYAQLSNGKTGQKPRVPHLGRHITQSHSGGDSVLTHTSTHHRSPSISQRRRQWARRLQTSRAIGAFDRWCHQRRRQDDNKLPLYHSHLLLLIVLITFHFLCNFSANYQRVTRKGRLSEKEKKKNVHVSSNRATVALFGSAAVLFLGRLHWEGM